VSSHARRRDDGEKGFSLIEVMIAMTVLALGLLAVAAAQLTAMSLASKSRNLTAALHLAQEQIETFNSMPLASLPATGNDPNNPIDPDTTDDDDTTYARRWTILPNTPAVGITTITVEVDWFDPRLNSTRTTSLQTMKGL
jgi:type IV pilus assembly protein PilV